MSIVVIIFCSIHKEFVKVCLWICENDFIVFFCDYGDVCVGGWLSQLGVGGIEPDSVRELN